MYINLANIDFGGEGGGKAVLQETTIETLLTETTKVVTPPEGVDGFNKVTVTHAPVEESVSATITENGTHTITPSAGFDAMFGVSVNVNVPGDNLDTSNIIGTKSWWDANKNRYCGLQRDTDADPNYEVPNSLRGGICSQVPYTGELVALKNNGDTGVPMKTWNDSWENVNNKNGQVYINHLCDLDISSNSETYNQPYPYVILNNITGKREIVGVDASDNVDYTYNYDESTSETARYSKGYPIECIEIDDTFFINPDVKYLNYLNKPFVIQLYSNLSWNNYYLNKLLSGVTLPDVVLLYNDTDTAAHPGSLSGFEINDSYRFTGSTTILYPSWKSIEDVKYVSCSDTPGLSSIPNWIEEINNVSNTSSATNMSYAFAFCKALKKIPLFDVSKVTSAEGMFYFCKNLREIPEGMTFPKLVKTGGRYGMFQDSGITHISEGMIPGKLVNAYSMFSGCGNLTEISKLDLSEITQNDEAWGIVAGCKSLTTLGGFTGLKVSLDLSSSPLLTHDSLLNVINEAADVTASPQTLTLGATNLAKLTDEEKAIATSKGWTLK